MPSKPLSQRAAFKSAVVLSGFYSSAPGNSGICQFAIRKTQKNTGLWNWNDEYGAERIAVLPAAVTWRDTVTFMAGNELVASAIDPGSVQVIPEGGLIGQIYALAWSADEGDQRAALLLARLDDQSRELFVGDDKPLLSSSLRAALDKISRELNDVDVEIEDLAYVTVAGTSAADVRRAFRAAAARSVKERRALERDQAERLRPFESQIDELILRWRAGRLNSHYPGVGRVVPPPGLVLLRKYLRSYVLERGALPSGVQRVPGGEDGIRGPAPPFEVNFDDIAREDTSERR